MRKHLFIIAIFTIATINTSHAQFNMDKILEAGTKLATAITLSDEQMNGYVKEYITKMDSTSSLCKDDSPYAIRLAKITKNIDDDAINIKVYDTADANAFACADGSIRVYAGLMDIMDDQEILGVVGHEIGHIKNKDSKKAFKTALLTSALRDGLGSVGGKVAQLSESQVGDIGEKLAHSKFSQRKEYRADEYGYKFLKAHNENPWAMVQAFRKLEQMIKEMGGDKSNAIQQLFSTHPNLSKRIKKMEKRAKRDGIKSPL